MRVLGHYPLALRGGGAVRSVAAQAGSGVWRLAPMELLPWVEQLLRAGHTVHVYKACGFGFGLYRELKALGAHCYVIAPRKLDEQCRRVKVSPFSNFALPAYSPKSFCRSFMIRKT